MWEELTMPHPQVDIWWPLIMETLNVTWQIPYQKELESGHARNLLRP